ncbi:unnamed protein product, partial [Amoebophrya sp. A25]
TPRSRPESRLHKNTRDSGDNQFSDGEFSRKNSAPVASSTASDPLDVEAMMPMLELPGRGGTSREEMNATPRS